MKQQEFPKRELTNPHRAIS